MSGQPGGPRGPTQRGSCGGSPSLGTRPGALFWAWCALLWGASAGGGGHDRGPAQVTLPSWSPTPASCFLNGKGVWIGGGCFLVSCEICQVESSLHTFVTITPLLSLVSLFPEPFPLFLLYSSLFSPPSLRNCSLVFSKIDSGCGVYTHCYQILLPKEVLD